MKQLLKKTLITLPLLSVSTVSFGHGYISAYNNGVAESRVALCKFPANDTQEKNTNCGGIQYEPQSIEGPDGFPESGPVDGKIASAGTYLAASLDEQTADRWVKRPIKSGSQYFEWTFTANHVTRDWKYYITKPNWNPNQPLTRDSFDLTPFCVVDGNMVAPPMQVSHLCNVPEREGYQVILSVWDVGDTGASFYNVIDVKFDGDGPIIPDWNKTGQINPTQNLKPGDTVYTRVFDQSGENASYSTKLVIENNEQGKANNWSFALASKINKEQTEIKAGQLSNKGNFAPVYGANPVYLKANSGLRNVEIGYKIDIPQPDLEVEITGLESEYVIDKNHPTHIDLTLTATGDIQTELTVYNHHREALASKSSVLSDGDVDAIQLKLSKSEVGHHMLVVVTKDDQGNLVDQKTLDFQLKDNNTPPPAGNYDFIFPEGLKSYTAGTKVLSSDGSVYQCKEFPYSGFCVQWSPSATQFEPGVGSAWINAWEKVN